MKKMLPLTAVLMLFLSVFGKHVLLHDIIYDKKPWKSWGHQSHDCL